MDLCLLNVKKIDNKLGINPTISVHMVCYNQQDYISDAINSVINQTYQDWELVIGDDCSTDKTFEIVKSFAKKFPKKILCFKNSSNIGITKNCNRVLNSCSGEFITFIAGDDIFLPNKLENQIKIMLKDDNCILSYHDVEVFDNKNGEILKYWNHGKNSCKPVIGNSKIVAKSLITKGTSFLSALSVMARRNAIPKTGYDCRVLIASDWTLWIDICAGNNGNVKFINKILARYRKHKEGITSKPFDYYKFDDYVTLALTEYKYPFLINEVRKARGRLNYIQGVKRILDKNYSEGRKLLIGGVFYSLYSPKLILWVVYSYYMQLFKNK